MNLPSIKNRRHIILIVFSIGCLARLIPELMAYPYPIGYDVINYYIPTVTNFQEHWSTVSKQFPLYVLILYSIHYGVGFNPQLLVTTFAIMIFGLFAVSIYQIGDRLLQLEKFYCLFLVIFVIFQMPVLRTAWDLHRDIFSFTTMFFTFSLLSGMRGDKRWYMIYVAIILSSITVAADRMIGALFVGSLIIYTLVFGRTKAFLLTTVVASIVFFIAIASSSDLLQNIIQAELEQKKSNLLNLETYSYNSLSLITLFAVVNGPLVPTAIIGFKFCKNILMKIPVVITVVASFSWVIFPDTRSLVADRWIFVCGLLLSILAAYGIIQLVQRTRLRSKNNIVSFSCVLAIVVTVGTLYEVMPYQHPFIIYGLVRNMIEPFAPVTMQFNSLDVRNNEELLSTISWINQNTPPHATIIGEKHWRGWMELRLSEQRTYLFFSTNENIINKLTNCEYVNCYIVMHVQLFSRNVDESKFQLVHNIEDFRIFRIRTD